MSLVREDDLRHAPLLHVVGEVDIDFPMLEWAAGYRNLYARTQSNILIAVFHVRQPISP